MPKTANQELFDALVRHQINLLRLSDSVARDIHLLLDATERDIKHQIERAAAIEAAAGALSGRRLAAARAKRLNRLLNFIRAARAKAWDEINESWVQNLEALVQDEIKNVNTVTKTVSPAVLATVLPDPARLKTMVQTRVFEGKTLKEWAQNVKEADLTRIEQQIKIGVAQGESPRQIARRITGTASLRGSDGVTEIARHNALSITRTAVNAMANGARQEYFQANSDLFEKEVYVATLDARTTPVCRGFDGKRFNTGEGPVPPLHFNCRSLRVVVFNDQVIGNRPARAFTEKGLLRDFAKQEKIGVPGSRAGLPRGLKGKYDAYARQRMRTLTGPIPAKTTYQEWLKSQSAEFQNDILGPARGALFRRGGLKLDRFTNDRGREYTLSELSRLEKKAFKAAGLDVHDFR